MRILVTSLLICIAFSVLSQQKPGDKRLKYFDSGTMFFERTFPACKDYNAAGVPNFNAIGLEGEFLSLTFGQWNWRQRVSATLGGKETVDLIPNIQFQGGYEGGLSVWSNRFSASLGTVIAYQPNPNLEIGIPLMFTARMTSNVGKFYLYDGQDVDDSDIVESYEASSANRIVIDRKWMPGFKTGLEIVAWPNNFLSGTFRINYQYFGWRDVYDISTAQLNASDGSINVSHDRVWSTPEWGFSIGLKYYFVRASTETHQPERKERKKENPVILVPEKRQ